MEQKSSMIAGLIINQKVGQISSPVKGSDGWYIFKLVNVWKEAIPNESELVKLKEDSERALEKSIMDSLSDNYVRKLFVDLNPQIDGKTFYVLRLYLAKYEVDEKKFNEWNLEAKLDSILKSYESLKQDINALVLVNMKEGSYSIKDFIDWLRYREQLVKFKESDFNSFSGSVEEYIWRMVRDNSLAKIAFTRGYQNKKNVREQLGWWKDKIVYALVRDEIINSGEINNSKDSFKFEYKPLSDEANKKLVHKVLALKQKNKININKDLLNQIKVQN
jgi:Mor family transcriptional regulator